MSSQAVPVPTRPVVPVPRLTWRCWPLADASPWSWAVPPGIVAIGLLVEGATSSWYYALAAGLCLGLSLWRFLLPVHYALSDRGVTQRVLGRVRHVPWRAIRACEIRDGGVMLYRVAQPLGIDAFRGLYIPWGPHRTEVLSFVDRYFAPRDTVEPDEKPA